MEILNVNIQYRTTKSVCVHTQYRTTKSQVKKCQVHVRTLDMWSSKCKVHTVMYLNHIDDERQFSSTHTDIQHGIECPLMTQTQTCKRTHSRKHCTDILKTITVELILGLLNKCFKVYLQPG